MTTQALDGWLERVLPKAVNCNRNTGLLKVIASVSMLLDHLEYAIFPYEILNIIGRLAFPIYAYCAVVGCVYTKNPARYVAHLLILALISQPLFVAVTGNVPKILFSFAEQPLQYILTYYAESWRHPSVLVTLSLGISIICALRNRQYGWLLLGIVISCLVRNIADYGGRGIILMLLFYFFIDKPKVSCPIVALYMVWWGLHGNWYNVWGIEFSVQMFALMALPLIYIPMRGQMRVPKWIFYAYYPTHLLAIILIQTYWI